MFKTLGWNAIDLQRNAGDVGAKLVGAERPPPVNTFITDIPEEIYFLEGVDFSIGVFKSATYSARKQREAEQRRSEWSRNYQEELAGPIDLTGPSRGSDHDAKRVDDLTASVRAMQSELRGIKAAVVRGAIELETTRSEQESMKTNIMQLGNNQQSMGQWQVSHGQQQIERSLLSVFAKVAGDETARANAEQELQRLGPVPDYPVPAALADMSGSGPERRTRPRALGNTPLGKKNKRPEDEDDDEEDMKSCPDETAEQPSGAGTHAAATAKSGGKGE